MCVGYYRQSDKQKIAGTFHVAKWVPDAHLAPDYNIAPSTFQPILRSSPEDGEREVVLMRWGLIPAKVAEPDAFTIFSTTNARRNYSREANREGAVPTQSLPGFIRRLLRMGAT
jgi:putative SOS response-associated peptidase YedK